MPFTKRYGFRVAYLDKLHDFCIDNELIKLIILKIINTYSIMKPILHDLLIGVAASAVTLVAMVLLQNSCTEVRSERILVETGKDISACLSSSSVRFETTYVPRPGRNVTVAIYGDDMEVVE